MTSLILPTCFEAVASLAALDLDLFSSPSVGALTYFPICCSNRRFFFSSSNTRLFLCRNLSFGRFTPEPVLPLLTPPDEWRVPPSEEEVPNYWLASFALHTAVRLQRFLPEMVGSPPPLYAA